MNKPILFIKKLNGYKQNGYLSNQIQLLLYKNFHKKPFVFKPIHVSKAGYQFTFNEKNKNTPHPLRFKTTNSRRANNDFCPNKKENIAGIDPPMPFYGYPGDTRDFPLLSQLLKRFAINSLVILLVVDRIYYSVYLHCAFYVAFKYIVRRHRTSTDSGCQC